jgi:hypothetical protein
MLTRFRSAGTRPSLLAFHWQLADQQEFLNQNIAWITNCLELYRFRRDTSVIM